MADAIPGMEAVDGPVEKTELEFWERLVIGHEEYEARKNTNIIHYRRN